MIYTTKTTTMIQFGNNGAMYPAGTEVEVITKLHGDGSAMTWFPGGEYAWVGAARLENPPARCETINDRAADAFALVFTGPWGLKASYEDAILAVLEELYPNLYPASAKSDNIYKLRDNAQLEAIVEDVSEDLAELLGDADEICKVILPRIADILGDPS